MKLSSLILKPLSDHMKKSMHSPADQILWQIFDDNLTVKELTKDQKETIELEYGAEWVSDLGVDTISSHL